VAASGHYKYGPIYTSTNCGASWELSGAPNRSWISVASSANGERLVAATVYAGTSIGEIYTSTDSGKTWVSNAAPALYWESVASSAEGRRLVAASTSGLYPFLGAIYTSTNSGGSWQGNVVSNLQWSAVASSADGNQLFAAAYGGGIHATRSTPYPELSLSHAGSAVALDWIIPSREFGVEESTDPALASWTALTNVPSLDPESLRYRLLLPAWSDSRFYRLASH